MRPVLIAAAFAMLATGAHAHARLQSSNPAPNAVLKAAPAEIRVEFDDELDDWKSTLALADAQGRAIAIGRTRLTGKPARGLAAPVGVRLRPGLYHVRWQASSSDGHAAHGEFAFTLRP